MKELLVTDTQNTWCPGCGNFAIQHTLKSVITEKIEAGVPRDHFVLVSGIGCHAKIADYLNINSFYAIHGRVLPVATGIKLANPDLTVICCAGDGDAYAEGLDHLIFAAKRNIDLTVIIHNNRVYGLTTGQYTPTSPLGFKGRSTPQGTVEAPLNPPGLMLASGATHIARGYTRNLPLLKRLIHEGIDHRGFSFIDTLQICASFYNMTDYYDERVYEISIPDPEDAGNAWRMIHEWDYNADAPIALGTFFKTVRDSFENNFRAAPLDRTGRERRLADVIEEMI